MPATIQSFASDLEKLTETVEGHDVDLYQGKDKDNPSITTRLALLEKDMKELIDSRKENRVWFMGIIGGIITALILMHLKVI